MAARAQALPEAPAASVVISHELGARQLRYLAGLVVLLALFESSELPGGRGVVLVALLAGAVAVGGLAVAFRAASESGPPTPALRWVAPIHYLVPVLSVGVAAAFAFVIGDWRLALLAQALMGGAVFASSYVTVQGFLGRSRPGHEFLHDAAVIFLLLGSFLAIYLGAQGVVARLVLVLVITFLAAYESFLPVGKGDAEAIFYSQSVAVVTTAIAFALTYTGLLPPPQVAVILMLVWYVERGLIVHFVSASLTRNVLREYALLGLVAIALIANALINR